MDRFQFVCEWMIEYLQNLQSIELSDYRYIWNLLKRMKKYVQTPHDTVLQELKNIADMSGGKTEDIAII